jgi:hypothetical protein
LLRERLLASSEKASLWSRGFLWLSVRFRETLSVGEQRHSSRISSIPLAAATSHLVLRRPRSLKMVRFDPVWFLNWPPKCILRGRDAKSLNLIPESFVALQPVRHIISALLLTGTLWAATDPFIGAWKLDPAKSKLTDQMRVETATGANTYIFYLSATNPETIVADGTDQPGIFGTTLAVTVLGPNQWKVVRKKDGHMLISAIWDLSADGNMLTDNFTGYRADGSTNNLLYKYKRAAGKSGFAGTWESISEEVKSSYEMQVESYEGDGLSFITPSQKMTKSLKFDGKDYPGQGPNLPAGYTTSGRRVSDHEVELTDKINGKVLDTQQVEMSPDGKTITFTIHIPGVAKPNVQVFEGK